MEFNHPNLIVGPIRNEQLRRDRCCETINTIFAILLTIIAIGVCITISEYYRILRENGQLIQSAADSEYDTRLHAHKSRTKIEVDLAIKICTIPMLLNCLLFAWAIALLWRSRVVKAHNSRAHIDRCHVWASVSAYSSKLTLIVFLPVILFGLPDIDHKVAILFMHLLCFMFWLGQRQKVMILLGEVMQPTQVQMSIRPLQRGGRGREGGPIPADSPPNGGQGHPHPSAHVSPFEEPPKYTSLQMPPSYADATGSEGSEVGEQPREEGEAPPPGYSEIKTAEESSAL